MLPACARAHLAARYHPNSIADGESADMRDRKIDPRKTYSFGEGGDDSVCAGHALGFPLQKSLGFCCLETTTLDAFRCVCDVYATNSAQPWEHAMKLAEEQLGELEGPVFIAKVTALLRALRRERALGLSYLSIGCRHVSPDELAVTGLLKSVRIKDHAAFERGIALTLANGRQTDRTRSAVRSLAAFQSLHLASPSEPEIALTDFETQTVQVLYLH